MSDDVVYHDITGLEILAAAQNGGYLVWCAGALAWRAGVPARGPQGLWYLVADDGVYDLVVSGVQLALAMFGPRRDMWHVMAMSASHRVIAVARTPEAREYVWVDHNMAAVVYPEGASVYGPYTQRTRAVWHTIPDDV